MVFSPNASRHSTEFAANAISANPVNISVFMNKRLGLFVKKSPDKKNGRDACPAMTWAPSDTIYMTIGACCGIFASVVRFCSTGLAWNDLPLIVGQKFSVHGNYHTISFGIFLFFNI
jgi:hypothetical protein